MDESAGQSKPGAPAATHGDVGASLATRAGFPSPGERPFHVAIAALAFGLALAEARPELVLAAAGGLGALVLFLGAPRPGAPRLGAIAAALVLAGAAIGELRVHAIDGPAGRVRDGEAVDLRAQLLTAPRAGQFGSSAEIAVVGGRLHGARLLLRIARWAPLPASAEPGSELALEGRLSALGKRPGDGPGGFDFAAHLRRRGIAGELMLERARLTGLGAEEWPACSTVLARAPSERSAPEWRRIARRCCAAWCSARTSGSPRASGRTFARAVWHICSPCRARM